MINQSLAFLNYIIGAVLRHEEEILRLVVNLKMNSLLDLMCIRNNTTVICLSEVFIQSSHRKTVTGYDIMKYISSPY